METSYTQAAGIIFVNSRGEVLLQLRDDIPTIRYPNVWGLVGGHVEPGETVEEALVRETEEEVGVTLDGFVFYGVFRSVYADVGLDVHVYAASLEQAAESLTITEGQRVEFFALGDAIRLELVPWLASMLPGFFASPVYTALANGSSG